MGGANKLRITIGDHLAPGENVRPYDGQSEIEYAAEVIRTYWTPSLKINKHQTWNLNQHEPYNRGLQYILIYD